METDNNLESPCIRVCGVELVLKCAVTMYAELLLTTVIQLITAN